MQEFKELKAEISHTGCSVIASCIEEDLVSVGNTEFEAVQKLKELINQRYERIFPIDQGNT